MQGLGNILILAPSDPVETEQILRFALSHRGPVYVRMDSGKFPILHDERYRFEPGAVDVLKQGSDVTLAAVGSVVYEAFYAAGELGTMGISTEVLNISSIRPLDEKVIVESISKTKRVITVEEHSLHGGLGALISEIISEHRVSVELLRLGITKGQFSKAGPREEIRAYYRIDHKGIVNAAQELMDRPHGGSNNNNGQVASV
jgi:transketolase